MPHLREMKIRLKILRAFWRIVSTSLLVALFMAGVGAMYSWLVHGEMVLRFLFEAGILAGAFLLVVGCWHYVRPVLHNKDKLVDRSTYRERTAHIWRGNRLHGYELMLYGFATALIAALAQMLVYFIF